MTRVAWFHPRAWGPPRGGGDLRTHGLVRCAELSGHEVLMVTPAGAGTGPAARLELPSPRGVRLAVAKALSRHPLRSPRVSRSGAATARGVVTRWRPEVAVVSEVMAWSLARPVLPGDVPLVYDAANVESRLFRALSERATGADRLTFAVDARRVARAERALLERADAVLAVSDDDRDEFVRLGVRGSVHVVPSSVPTPGITWDVAATSASVLFVGTLDYFPNVDAVEELVHEVLPRIRREEDVRLVVVGRRPAPGLRKLLASTPWAELHEDVPDLRPHYLGSRCVVLPLRSGGGTKLKVYEALSYGVPVVGTPAAVSGIPLADDEVLVGESADELARAVVGLLRDDAAAAAMGRAARRAFDDRLAWERASRERLDAALRAAAR